jgi:hydrogenase maturation protein HypF
MMPAVNSEPARAGLTILGAVQGVGFRPFLFRLATEIGLNGWVANFPGGVLVEVEGARTDVGRFIFQIDLQKPPYSFIQSMETRWLEPTGFSGFEIRKSTGTGARTALIMPDIATCPDCVREIFDPGNRRYHYPFTNCTHCGPRFSIIEALPYDRANTSMRGFEMCSECRAEYENPQDRRFHAQPNACPVCGPQVELWSGAPTFQHGAGFGSEALAGAAEAIRAGKILAVKGLGGFHLMCDARCGETVGRLRALKHREEKPFAIMVPALEVVRSLCEISEIEERLLRSSEAPIVLLRSKSNPISQNSKISPSVAPGNPYLGVMLPYTPLHHLLLRTLGFPVVATSGNLADEPICTDAHEAVERLGGIADSFLVHNRPIVRHADDSIVRVMAGREMVLRRARGFAPLPVVAGRRTGGAEAGSGAEFPVVLAVGAHLKNSVALGIGNQIFVSQHIGDLETEPAFHAFKKVISDLQRLHDVSPAVIAADAHPDYLSTKFARRVSGARVLEVQHHHAHVLSCMVENELEGPVLGVAWDGSGFGSDGTIWGGEFLRVTGGAFERMAHFRTFRLPGGETAVREPRRAAIGILFEMAGGLSDEMKTSLLACRFSPGELPALMAMLERGLNAPVTSSVGRLFDAVASLVGLRQCAGFEGQAAMDLEFALDGVETDQAYLVSILEGIPLVVDWQPMILEILADVESEVPTGEISAKFHNGLVEAILSVAHRAGENRVVLTGGCFQNRYLLERAVNRLRAEGLQPFWHQRIPPNDGGIAVGQVAAARRSRP